MVSLLKFRSVPVILLAFPLVTAWIEGNSSKPIIRPEPGTPWPYPKEMTTGQDMMTLNPIDFTMTTNALKCEVIQAALDRYRNLIFLIGKEGKADPGLRKLFGLDVKIYYKSDCGYPYMDNDESYTIQVEYYDHDQVAHLSANTVWGALRGLETFSQLVFIDDRTKTYRINTTTIYDKPRFSYRGIMLDTARHYLPVELLKQNLEAMAYNKFNVFHWHIVDDQSYPFESLIYPNLTTLGAFDKHLVYTQLDVKEVVEYARLRGIRVIPEFDTPAHTRAMGIAFPHLRTTCFGSNNVVQYSEQGILNPTLQNTYDVLNEILQEFKQVFPDDYVHLGMNDFSSSCWDKNPSFDAYRKILKLRDYDNLGENYVSRVISIAQSIKYKPMVWQEAVENYSKISGKPLVQIWKDSTLDAHMLPWTMSAKNIAKQGYKLVISSCWNLNYISYGEDWLKYYQCDPQNIDPDDDTNIGKMVVGGEALLWGEFVDKTNLMARLWPRASAVGERLWSYLNDFRGNFNVPRLRLDQHRCRMFQRGIPAQPMQSGYCGEIDKNTTMFSNNFQSPNFTLLFNITCNESCECPEPNKTNHFKGTSDSPPFFHTFSCIAFPIFSLFVIKTTS